MNILIAVAILFFIIGLLLFFLQRIPKKINLQLEKSKENPRIAIIIPARDESKVIEPLLDSILSQTVKINPLDIYVIVENENDPTIQIAKEKRMSIFVRKKLHLKTKGYALQELIEDLERKEKYYDCYFIFDADNLLEPTFIEFMLEDYKKGYAIATGYRLIKNKDHYFSLSAWLTFLLINEIHNKASLKNNGSLILSGTGYYIHGNLIKKWKTFPFHSLTEDYESSLYYAKNHYSMHYCTKAIFYDEQPYDYRQSIIQRSRWIKGYFQNWMRYRKQFRKTKPKNIFDSAFEMYIGIEPLLFFILSGICFLFIFIKKLWILLFFVIGIYLFLVILTLYLLQLAKKKISISKKIYVQALVFHPIFLMTYIHALMHSFSKNLGWDKIKHGT